MLHCHLLELIILRMQGLTDLHDKSYQGQFWLICKYNFGFKGTLSLWKEQFFILEYFIDSKKNRTKRKTKWKLIWNISLCCFCSCVCLFVCPPSEHRFQLNLDILSISNTTEDYDAYAKGTNLPVQYIPTSIIQPAPSRFTRHRWMN